MNAAPADSPDQAQKTALRPGLPSLEQLAPYLVAVTLLALILSLLVGRADADPRLAHALNIISYLAGGAIGLKTALESLREGKIDVDLLMILAALGAAFIDQWHEGAILLFLFSLSNVLQDYAIGRSRNAIRSLFALYPQTAKIRRGDDVIDVEIDAIRVGDIVLIEPGERVPVDGDVIRGDSSVDESPITGESLPADKSAGDRVFAGSLNKQGILDVRATRLAANSTLSRIIELVEEAQDSKAPTERSLERFEQRYATLIILSVALFIVLPPLLGLAEFESNFYRAMVLMTVASPCALVISVPSAIISAIASAARIGVLFKGGASLEQLATVKAFAFDKTGTLTLGEPRVTDITCAAGVSRHSLVVAAASAEARSEHPLAKAIVAYSVDAGMPLSEPDNFTAIPGKGVRATLDGCVVQVGRVSQLARTAELPHALRQAHVELERAGKTVVAVLRDGVWLGLIALADESRADASALMTALKAVGVHPFMLTGDNKLVAASIAAEIGIERVYAGLLPEDKVEVVRQMQQEFGAVAMVGDGINDAPAMAQADISIAMGGAGADVALETADAVLMSDQLGRILDAQRLSARARQVVRQNIGFSLAVIAMLTIGVFAVELPLPLGVLGHEGSTVIVVLNGLLSLLVLPEIRRRRSSRNNASDGIASLPNPRTDTAALDAGISRSR